MINLQPAIFRSVESNGMLLATVYLDNVVLLTAKKSEIGNRVYINGVRRVTPMRKVSFENWKKIKLTTQNNKIKFEDYFLKTDKEEIFTDKKVPDGCNIQ